MKVFTHDLDYMINTQKVLPNSSALCDSFEYPDVSVE
jgi:hypothetical protein